MRLLQTHSESLQISARPNFQNTVKKKVQKCCFCVKEIWWFNLLRRLTPEKAKNRYFQSNLLIKISDTLFFVHLLIIHDTSALLDTETLRLFLFLL